VVVPFEKVFGDTSELRVIQFLLPMKDYEFNISDLARGSGVSRQALNSVVRKLLKWHVLKVVSKRSNANYYAFDKDSGFLGAFEDLNNYIIEQMLGEETLTKIAIYSVERHIKIQPVEELSQYHARGWLSESPDSWSRLHLEDRPKPISFEKSLEVKKENVYAGGAYAAA
jgi:DNA-binding Lrp family transcriptional regulator